jgi:hypothetical protein
MASPWFFVIRSARPGPVAFGSIRSVATPGKWLANPRVSDAPNDTIKLSIAATSVRLASIEGSRSTGFGPSRRGACATPARPSSRSRQIPHRGSARNLVAASARQGAATGDYADPGVVRSRAEPEVRIHLPPAGSHQRTARLLENSGGCGPSREPEAAGSAGSCNTTSMSTTSAGAGCLFASACIFRSRPGCASINITGWRTACARKGSISSSAPTLFSDAAGPSVSKNWPMP